MDLRVALERPQNTARTAGTQKYRKKVDCMSIAFLE
jgi:hypothetical protein